MPCLVCVLANPIDQQHYIILLIRISFDVYSHVKEAKECSYGGKSMEPFK